MPMPTCLPVRAIICLLALWAASSSFAQTLEVEPNDAKSAATLATLDGLVGGMAAQAVGTTTGASSFAGPGSYDYWRLRTAAAPTGVYRHVIALSTSGTAGHTLSLIGLTSPTGSFAQTEAIFSTGSTITNPPRAVYWYGFGKQEQVYARVSGLGITTAPYTITLTSSPVTIIDIPGTLYAGQTLIQTSNNAGFLDSEISLYDAQFNPVPGAAADNVLSGAGGTLNGATVGAGFIRNLPPGTYHLALGGYNLASNQAAPVGDFQAGNVLDFPDAIASSVVNGSGFTQSNVGITDQFGSPLAIGSASFSNPVGDIRWFRFTLTPAPFPSGLGSAAPNQVGPTQTTTLSVDVTPAAGDTLSGITSVVANVSVLSGAPSPDNRVLSRVGTSSVWSTNVTVGPSIATGAKIVPVTITDSQARTGPGNIALSIVPTPPINDRCSGAIVLSLGVPSAPISNANALLNEPTPACQSNASRGVWFSIVPPTTGVYTFDSCASNFDTALDIVTTSDCAALSPTVTSISCNDDRPAGSPACGNSTLTSYATATLNAGQLVYVRVFSYGTFNSGNVSVLATSTSILGACCAPSGSCSLTAQTACTGSWGGPTSTCSPNTCPVLSACCIGSNACVVLAPSICTGTFGGTINAAATCAPSTCGVPVNDSCLNAVTLSLDQLYIGSNAAAIDPDLSDGPAPSCQLDSRFGVWFSFTPTTTALYRISTCGSPQDDILTVFSASSTCGNLQELALDAIVGTRGCDDDTCIGGTLEPGPGGAAGAATAATIDSTRLVAGATHLIRLSTWTSGTPGNYQIRIREVGACCLGGSCSFVESTFCAGTFTSDQACSPTLCTPPEGVCCRGATCATLSQTNCSTPAGSGAGAAFVASATCGGTTTPCCHADYDKLGGVGVPDIFAYLNDWFAGSPMAFFAGDGSGSPSVSNLFDYLNAWFVGC
ncbi:MAG: hypothetical protein K2W85_02750 [Phycisphaerales bacterium]|nr:hypothetical protein [Phycisphaerales bacterium]